MLIKAETGRFSECQKKGRFLSGYFVLSECDNGIRYMGVL